MAKALGDLIIGWLNTDGSVDVVSVDGESDFSKGTRFERDVRILVSNHSFPPDDEEAPNDSEAEPMEPESPPAPALDAVTAAQHLAYAWEDRMVYGGTVRWILDRITTVNADQTYTFKIGVTLKNAYGTEYHGTIEGDVGGTNDAPIILDSILYTDAGEIINYYG